MASIKPNRAGALQKILGHDFKDHGLLDAALQHRSATSGRDIGYERLEFLGDRVLGLCVADMVMAAFPHEPEGDLARRFNGLVCGEILALIARELDMGPYIELSKSERAAGSADNATILADVMEALIAALYIDGGLDAARQFITRYWQDKLKTNIAAPKDAKSGLQEWAMARGLDLPRYDVVERQGPDHAPEFIMSVTVDGHGHAKAKGTSKKLAARDAATKLLDILEKGKA